MDSDNNKMDKEILELEKEKLELEKKKFAFELDKSVSSRFKDLWESYNKVVTLNITLQTAVIAFFINSLSSNTSVFSYEKLNQSGKDFAFFIIVNFCIGIVIGVTWRVLSQIYMEKDVFGNPKMITNYMKKQEDYDKHNYYFQRDLPAILRKIWSVSVWGSWIVFFLSMVMFGVFYSLTLKGVFLIK